MNLTFSNNRIAITSRNVRPELVSKLGGTFITNPEIVDGMGERLVMCDCNTCIQNNLTAFAEIIVLEWEIGNSQYQETFMGSDSYLIQNILHKLEL